MSLLNSVEKRNRRNQGVGFYSSSSPSPYRYNKPIRNGIGSSSQPSASSFTSPVAFSYKSTSTPKSVSNNNRRSRYSSSFSSAKSKSKIKIRTDTMQAMKNEADLQLSYPTSLYHLADCIANSQCVMVLHSTRSPLLVEEEEGDVNVNNDNCDELFKNMSINDPSEKIQQELKCALEGLQTERGALERNILSWEDAKMNLSKALLFLDDDDEHEHEVTTNNDAHGNANVNVAGSSSWERMELRSPGSGSTKKRKVTKALAGRVQVKKKKQSFLGYYHTLREKHQQKKLKGLSGIGWDFVKNFPIPGLRGLISSDDHDRDHVRGNRDNAGAFPTFPRAGAFPTFARKYDDEKEEVENEGERQHRQMYMGAHAQQQEEEVENETVVDALDRLFRRKIELEERKLRERELAEKERIQREIEEREERERLEQEQREAEAKKAAQNLLRQLTEDEQEIVHDAMYGTGPGSEKLASTDTDSVQRSSMQTLRPGAWLNDEVIHFFFNMLAKRDESLCAADPNRKRCHYFKSFFFTKLFDEGASNQYRFANVKRWSRRVPGKDIFSLDKIFFACNVSSMHWTCAVVFMQRKRIQFFDSMRGDGYQYSEGLMKYITDEWKAKKGGELPDKDQWEIVGNEKHVPTQQNGFDCGVFTCMFADFLSLDRPLTFTQEHITQCRERIALSIMKGVAIE